MADHRNSGNHPTANKGGGGASGGYKIDTSRLVKRLQSLYSHWREHRDELWGSCTAFAAATPPPSDDLRYLKSSALNLWLLGYEFPDTVMVFSEKQIHFLCSQKKASLLDGVKRSAKEAVNVDVVMHVKAKDDDGLTQMDVILHSIDSLDSPNLGCIVKEAPEGKLLKKWTEKIKSSGLKLSDITNGLADLFAVKEAGELMNVKIAASLTASVMKQFVVPKLEKVIDEAKKVTHSSLMDVTEKVILDPDRMKLKLKLKADNVDICYPPVFQSGGNFDLRPSAASNHEHLYYDSGSVIICALGSRYSSYCANVARTFLIDSNDAQSKAYQVLLKAHDAAVGALKPGNKASGVYKAALEVVEKEAPELTSKLTKSAGTGMGLEFRESALSLNEKNERILKAGMVLNVSLGFQDMQTQSSEVKSRKYALLIADTVVVTATGRAVMTSLSSKAFKDVAYSLEDGEEEEEDVRPQVKVESNRNEDPPSKATLRSDNHEKSKEALRRQSQAELAQKKNEETAQRLARGKSATGDGRSSSRTSSDLIAYKNINDVPPPRDLMIQVDQRHEAILIPLYGSMVPFHVATVKSVSSQADTSRNCYIRIIFNVPGTPFSSHDPNSVKNQTDIFLKEVSFRSKDPRHVNEVVQQIKTLRRNVVSRESERAERASLVNQEKLVLAGNKFKPLRLTDLLIRPPFPGRGRKLPGTLEVHDNGFRYSTSRADERVDILFGNIKHAFFQAAEKELITLLHFHLYNHIMVGNKKTKDVQFYVEVMDVVQTLGGGKRSAYDPDEIEEEQREQDRKNKINTDFLSFVNRVNGVWGQAKFKGLELEFDPPVRDLGFHGVPHKASAFIVPTSSCLVELIETPFLVVTLSEIEIVNFERVGLGQKSIDMAIVFKDFKRDVLRIDSIPSTSLDGIKEWLNTIEIKYYESRLNLNWRATLKTITDDPQDFIDRGGWEFLNLEAIDSDSDGSQDSDQGYQPSDVEPESESEDDGSEVESDDEEEEEEESGSEEEGKSWDELLTEARNDDRANGNESDSEEDRKRWKIKDQCKSRAGPSSSAPKRTKY